MYYLEKIARAIVRFFYFQVWKNRKAIGLFIGLTALFFLVLYVFGIKNEKEINEIKDQPKITICIGSGETLWQYMEEHAGSSNLNTYYDVVKEENPNLYSSSGYILAGTTVTLHECNGATN